MTDRGIERRHAFIALRDDQPHEFNTGFIEAYEDANGPLPANWQSLSSNRPDVTSRNAECLRRTAKSVSMARTRIVNTIEFVESNLTPG